MSTPAPTLRRFVIALCAVAVVACNQAFELGDPSLLAGPPDLSRVFTESDLPPVTLNECGDTNQTCTILTIGPPFPLESDPRPDPAEQDVGLRRDFDGFLGLSEYRAGADRLWIANNEEPRFAGTVSKIDSRTIRELARYPSVTCHSLPTGSRQMCDGTRGCCAFDDWERYQARRAGLPEPPHQAVQIGANDPSRTAVDWNGDLFVANRAFGGQSSVTRIAGDPGRCADDNGNGRIDTSSDINANGVIDDDCNADGLPDDLDSVARRPCQGGARQEYFGLDDECVRWTTNTFKPKAVGRPLALMSVDIADPWGRRADAWAGSYASGAFVRIDGESGRCKDDAQLPDACWKNGTGPYGMVIDAGGVAWSVDLGQGKLCFFDARLPGPTRAGVVRDPTWGTMEGYGITLDRDDNIWVGGGVARYVPDRASVLGGGGFGKLGGGWWTRIANISGTGIAADSRSQGSYFVWSCDGKGSVLQIPASAIPPVRADQIIVPNAWPSIQMPCHGVGLDAQQNVWGIGMQLSTRALVDRFGAIAQPSVNGSPSGNNKCPAGDSCPNAGAYTYSDLSGFGFRNFTAPRGFYSYLVRSRCLEQNPNWGTRWLRAEWDVEVPGPGSFSVRARDGITPVPNELDWSPWTPPATANSIDFGQLPEDTHYLEVQFGFGTTEVGKSPKLKSAKIYYECLFEH